MMQSSELEQVVRLVMHAVQERLGAADAEVIEVVTREVVTAMTGVSGVPQRSTPQAPQVSEPAAADVPEPKTMVTARGATVPRPGVGQSLELCARCLEQNRNKHQQRAIVTTTGRNAKGVVATVSAEIAAANVDIQDISQTIVGDYFTMIMVVEVSELSISFAEFRERLLASAAQLGIHAVIMHEDVMRALQRV